MVRKSLSELKSMGLTPEEEAFRKGETLPSTPTPDPIQEELPAPATKASKAKPQTNAGEKKPQKKLVVELDEDLYEAFALVCMQSRPRRKMAKVVREYIEKFVKNNQ